tara:strand:+ start:799 stop:1116 length:318 start_codon:yes stop_codon:yes gene_type:complete
MLNINKNLKGENMKHQETIVANKLVQFAKTKPSQSIDYQSYLSVADLLNHHQFRAVQIVLEGLDSHPRDEILKIISTEDSVWNIMFKPLADGESFAFYETKTLTN